MPRNIESWVGKLPPGEADIPYWQIAGQMVTPREAAEAKREAATRWAGMKPMLESPPEIGVTDELLIQRIRDRAAQGRVPTRYVLTKDSSGKRVTLQLTAEEQIRQAEAHTEIGEDVLEAELKLMQYLENL